MAGDVFAEIDAGTKIATIWIDNPNRFNAMSIQMWERLAEVLRGLAQDPAVWVVAIRGVGGNFCAGADLSEFGEHRQGADTLVYDERTETALGLASEMSMPVIAFVEGYCLGGGVSIAVACDLVYAVDGASFQIPASRMGTAYPDGALSRLRDRIGYSNSLLLRESPVHAGLSSCYGPRSQRCYMTQTIRGFITRDEQLGYQSETQSLGGTDASAGCNQLERVGVTNSITQA